MRITRGAGPRHEAGTITEPSRPLFEHCFQIGRVHVESGVRSRREELDYWGRKRTVTVICMATGLPSSMAG